MEPMLIRELAKNYHHQRMIVNTVIGHVLVDISKDAIIECFNLDRSALKSINKERLKKEYFAKGDFYR